MFNNNYMGYSQYPQYNPNYMQGYQAFQQPIQRPMQPQPIQTNQEIIFSEVRYGTAEEAKAHLVPPNKAVMFINRNVGEFYIKSANGMGEPTFETFTYSKADVPVTPTTNTQEKLDFIKREDLKDYITFDDLNRFEEQIAQLDKKVNKALRLKELIGGNENANKQDTTIKD